MREMQGRGWRQSIVDGQTSSVFIFMPIQTALEGAGGQYHKDIGDINLEIEKENYK